MSVCDRHNRGPAHRGGCTTYFAGPGHWILEGWIGDHSVDFLVDPGSAVTALSCNFYQVLVRAGAPVGVFDPRPGGCETPMVHISISWDVRLVWCRSWGFGRSFPFWCAIWAQMLLLGRIRGDQYCHTPWISRKDCCLQREAYPFSCTTGTPHCQAASSRWDIVPSHHVLRRYHTYSGWPVAAVQWPFGGSHGFGGKHGPGGGPDVGGPNFGQETVRV